MVVQSEDSQPVNLKLMGPFLGHVTPTSIKVWLHIEGLPEVYVTVRQDMAGVINATGCLLLKPENLWTDCITLEGLQPDTAYHYQLWLDSACSKPMDLQGLKVAELRFQTLSDRPDEQVDFLVMSCHNPETSKLDGADGFAVWADIPQIISTESNKKVRFAILGGDQVYADAWQAQILSAKTHQERLKIYLDVYRAHWSNIHYRRVMCSLPAMLIWDDHDITDGWGSTEESFEPRTAKFKPDWQNLFNAASEAFSTMQASRNPMPLAGNYAGPFDSCFVAGRSGFVLMDLRSNRNVKNGVLLSPVQAQRIRDWVDARKANLDELFVVSPVVFSHGAPVIDDLTVSLWPAVMWLVEFFAKYTKIGGRLQASFGKSLGDIRDDIRDSWGAKDNANQTDMVLDYFFGLQNDPNHPVNVVILSGDIHTSGYANIYSSDPSHTKRASIPHITTSSVAYTPFNWLLEAIYRHAAKTVKLGKKGNYSSQVSHHFCNRNVSVLSIRPTAAGKQLKVKYYLEGYPEPQILMFDLDKNSHRENIAWVAQDELFDRDYTPSINFDVEADLEQRAKKTGLRLNIDESVVDLMKALGMDSSLGNRKRLAQQLGYPGTLNGSAEMNIWLHTRIRERHAAGRAASEEEVAAKESCLPD